ncbi:MAG: hypothetical protein H7Z72_17415 [Bacteroidetes bacterium]|nr:hypothetical protein [Fibrella sp.]
MFVKKNFLLIVILLAVVFAVATKATVFQKPTTPPAASVPAESAEFRAYWFAGQAELNSYTLQQARYGAINPGHAVLIFVTEDFRTDLQVKSESEASYSKSTPVLKTNAVRQFVTGVYDYSLFTSVFTPINAAIFPNTLKVSSSAQEWCGTTFTQLNLRTTGYQVEGHSYFEKEGEENYSTGKVLLEDELYNRIRLDPDKLPVGTVQLIPSAVSTRLRHKKMEPQSATITRAAITAQAWFGASASRITTADSLQTYSLDYTNDARKLTIVYEKAFPYRIMGWEETYDDFGKVLTSKATLTKTIRSDYWKHHAPGDSTLRHELLP